jgi:hypothetical protein
VNYSSSFEIAQQTQSLTEIPIKKKRKRAR